MRTSDGVMHGKKPRKSRHRNRSGTSDEQPFGWDYLAPYPAKPEGQNDTQAASHPLISDADFGLCGDI